MKASHGRILSVAIISILALSIPFLSGCPNGTTPIVDNSEHPAEEESPSGVQNGTETEKVTTPSKFSLRTPGAMHHASSRGMTTLTSNSATDPGTVDDFMNRIYEIDFEKLSIEMQMIFLKLAAEVMSPSSGKQDIVNITFDAESAKRINEIKAELNAQGRFKEGESWSLMDVSLNTLNDGSVYDYIYTENNGVTTIKWSEDCNFVYTEYDDSVYEQPEGYTPQHYCYSYDDKKKIASMLRIQNCGTEADPGHEYIYFSLAEDSGSPNGGMYAYYTYGFRDPRYPNHPAPEYRNAEGYADDNVGILDFIDLNSEDTIDCYRVGFTNGELTYAGFSDLATLKSGGYVVDVEGSAADYSSAIAKYESNFSSYEAQFAESLKYRELITDSFDYMKYATISGIDVGIGDIYLIGGGDWGVGDLCRINTAAWYYNNETEPFKTYNDSVTESDSFTSILAFAQCISEDGQFRIIRDYYELPSETGGLDYEKYEMWDTSSSLYMYSFDYEATYSGQSMPQWVLAGTYTK